MVANITNDISLLRQIREGNEDAFKSLFETYFTPLCRFIYLHLDDKNVAEELAMDIFIYLWENRETFQIQLSLKERDGRSRRSGSLYDQYQCVYS